MKKLVFVLLLCVLTACSEQAGSAPAPEQASEQLSLEDITETFSNPETGQSFEIIKAYHLYDAFIKEAEEADADSIYPLYRDLVINPIFDACFKDGEYQNLAGSVLNEVPNPSRFTEIALVSEQIEADQSIEIFKESLIKSSNMLPAEEETTVCVFPDTEGSEAAGVMVTVGAGKILAHYGDYFTEDIIRSATAHEYHHSVWAEQYADDHTLLDAMVFEGKAEKFAAVVYPEIERDIDYEKDGQLWEKAKPLLYEPFYNEQTTEVLYGGGDFPFSYGYSEGYKMVDHYLSQHPDLTPEEWTGIRAAEIYEDGSYDETY